MSGRGSRKLYYALGILLGMGAVAGTALMAYFSCRTQEVYIVLGAAVVCLLLFSPAVLVHELGHLLFGAVSGLRFPSVTIGHVNFSRRGVKFTMQSFAAGMSAVYPTSCKRVRAKYFICALGGGICNLLYGGVFLALYFLLPCYPALLFFELFAPLSLYEGIMALCPFTLPSGKTDGQVLYELTKNTAYAQNVLAVLSAQGHLYRGTYSDISYQALFDLPVIREDDLVFIALLSLQWRHLYQAGRGAEAEKLLLRLNSLAEYLPKGEGETIECDLALVRFLEEGVLSPAPVAEGPAAAILRFLNKEGTRETAEREIKKEVLYGERKFYTELLERGAKESNHTGAEE